MRVKSLVRFASVVTLLAASSLAVSFSASAGDDAANYPNRPVRLLAASAAGGNPDVIARLLSARLSEVFNNPFIVEDTPGVGGVIAANETVQAPPDGYTLSLNDSGALAINVAMNPDVKYTLKDFTPITALATLPTVLVVKPAVPAKTLAEFVALAKSKPNGLSFGSAGTGSIHQLTMIIFEQQAGIQLLHVPYRGGTGLVNALLTGEVDAGWSGISNVLALIKTGKLRALCLSVLERDASLPDVPTCAELGYKDFNVATMLGLQSSAGVSPAIVAKLQAAVAKVLREPAMAERMKTLGIHMAENGTAAYAKFMQDDLKRYTDVVNAFHLQIKP
ncbi:MAG TPA: tripartite tricarboxylate transporter substrate binding protein [Xanthobacteraceae bacterium]|nr:tripartite tricarboxylate transporter substrate binding protein [Xanthobacteraceae bacterium]